MPNQIIAPEVVRYSFNGLFGGNTVSNIWDVRVEDAGASNREENVPQIARNLLNAWCDHILPVMVNDYTFTDVSWVDLDSLDGTTGSLTEGGDEVLPQAGGSAAAPMPASVAIKVNKTIARMRGRKAGRLYLPGVQEAATTSEDPNHIQPATRTAVQAAFDAFLDMANEQVLNYTATAVVVHTKAPAPGLPPEYIGQSDVDGFTVDLLLATQRRRLRR